MTAFAQSIVGVIVIGRNEGERLRRCLASTLPDATALVYVDSGSTDGSPDLARAMGADVVALDMKQPFTAARARNAGCIRLRALLPNVEHVQFVDGDCEVDKAWIARASAFLQANPEVAAVCGRRRELFPEHSVYNRLCDIEWNTPVGETKACGGDVLMRADALQQVGGYRDELIAGEEPELCVRLRARGWRIWRLDAEMTRHDAAMTRFVQWWRRSKRAGFAFGEGARLHGAPPERHWMREARSAWVWGALMPVATIAAAIAWGPPALLGFLVYPLQVARLGLGLSGLGPARWPRALFLVLGKFPEAQGLFQSWWMHLRQRRAVLIEYK
ncbi:glycosyltransferase family 2 protein [Rhizobacter sp. Root404]|uniref:glycosyltransferase n=1 Tax=Rhizobacter sp. Root404 TaxID=1736528 RepID=UPI0006F2A67E|nr:glycosyltransferase [Rhizobacter sp. Root404]KQW40262.1 glycosyl transferase [Rhizobacter sp. Root404]